MILKDYISKQYLEEGKRSAAPRPYTESGLRICCLALDRVSNSSAPQALGIVINPILKCELGTPLTLARCPCLAM
jgi:hypothetical protein